MNVGLFLPCYVNQFYPSVGIATYQLLTKLGLKVDYPMAQSCCGQPMANSGFEHLTQGCNIRIVENFAKYDYIVGPSASCVLHIKEHLKVDGQYAAATHIRNNIYELVEFLTDILKVEKLDASFPHSVCIHQSCHGLRGLCLSQMSELNEPAFSKPQKLLQMVANLQLVQPSRADECCGFGGLFAINEEAVSVKMGKDRLADYLQNGAEYVTSADMSCLMHLEGIAKRSQTGQKMIHIAEILNANL
jgi:L-lactate dehydrogenase complex protein LldE